MNEHNRKRNVTESRTQKSVSKRNNDIKFKNTLIVFLIIACFLQAIYIIFFTLNIKENSVKKSFLSFYVKAQKEVSIYLATSDANTYSAYNYSQILTGTILNEEGNLIEIKDIDGSSIIPIVDANEKLDVNGVEYYVVNSDNIKSQLKLEIPNYKNITWYLSSNGDVKVKCDRKPNWWTSDLDGLVLGN